MVESAKYSKGMDVWRSTAACWCNVRGETLATELSSSGHD
jgi:hypothetical protein